ncbi:MAG: peptide chain release factor 1 [candidate division WOR-3 bacterium]
MNFNEILKMIEEIENKLAEYKGKDIALLEKYKRLKPLEEKIKEYFKIEKEIKDIEDMEKEEKDKEMIEFIKVEKNNLEIKKKEIEKEIKKLLIPKDPLDEKNAILEIRAGAGGEEAALFAKDLMKIYLKYAESKGYKVSITNIHETDLGGVREVVLLIEGKNAYGNLKYESGVHRVQRIPITETSGRIHTSTASVAVLPEYEDIEVEIDPKDLKIEVKRASGPGGQHVNVTDSAVRITHIPTGIVVQCQDERSQHKNKAKALRILKARIYEYEREKREKEIREKRKSQIGTQERSEKIRTYNFPQNRVTDHRINLTLYNLEEILEGKIDELIEKLKEKEEEEKLKEIEFEKDK